MIRMFCRTLREGSVAKMPALVEVVMLFLALRKHCLPRIDSYALNNFLSPKRPMCESINYRKTSNIRRNLVGNKTVDHSDVVGASPVGAAPTTSLFSTYHLASRESAKTAARQYENLLSV